MYLWRQLTLEERAALLKKRQACDLPWHSPPHQDWGERNYHITAACYEHKPVIGIEPERMQTFELQMHETIACASDFLHAWCILPNHYHLLVNTADIHQVLARIGKLHGRTSFIWNKHEAAQGRKIWCGCAERAIRSEGHFWATMNYVHHQPVHHKYTSEWTNWPYSSARAFLENKGRAAAAKIWREYPILNYGKKWDQPDL